MFEVLRQCFRFMTPRERTRYFALTSFRSLISILDLSGVLAIGYLATSMAMFVSQGSDSGRVISLGSLKLPAVNIHSLPAVVVLILCLFVFKSLLSLWLTRKTAVAIANVEARSAKAIATEILAGDQLSIDRLSRDEVIYLVQNGSPSAFNGLLNAVSTLVSEGFLFALLVASLLFVDVPVTLGMLAYFGLIGALIQYLVGGRMQRAGETLSSAALRANGIISDLVSVNRELKLTGRRAKFIEDIYQSRKQAALSLATQAYLAGTPRHVIESSLLLGIAGFGLVEALSGNLVSAATTLGVFLTGGFRIMASMLPLQTALIAIKGSTPNAKPALEILDGIGTHQDSSPVSTSLSQLPRIEISNLSFSYPNANAAALSDMNLTILPGQQIAVIGESGSGKSTLGELLAGILKPSQGSVLLDGVTAEEYVQSWPGRISIVPQAPGRIAGSILDNITLGQTPEEVDLRLVTEAVRLSHLEGVVNSLPDGLQTDLGKHNDALSGGQLQRLGLARALYTEPHVLILDEATSGLDANSEYEISLALKELRGKVTTILIAHRLHTVQDADVVLLLDAGAIEAMGTFEQLAKLSPRVTSAIEKSTIK